MKMKIMCPLTMVPTKFTNLPLHKLVTAFKKMKFFYIIPIYKIRVFIPKDFLPSFINKPFFLRGS